MRAREKAKRLTAVPSLCCYKLRVRGSARSTPTPLHALLKCGPISALVCINRSVIAYYNTIRAKEMREGKMLSANVEWQAQAPRPRITVAICTRTENESFKRETKREKERERETRRSWGWGRVVKHRAEANDNSGFNLHRRLWSPALIRAVIATAAGPPLLY